jgi:homoserine kinase
VPAFELRTKFSRQILPKSIGIQDFVFNASRIAFLTAAFCCSDFTLFKIGMQDKLHQPYRGKMIPSMDKVLEAALSAGAYGAYLSGSGPTLAAFCKAKYALDIQKNMVKIWKKDGVCAKTYELDFDINGIAIS